MVLDNEPGGPRRSNSSRDDSPLTALVEKLRSGQLPLPLIGAVAAVIVIGVIVAAVALGSSGGGEGSGSDDDPFHAGLLTPDVQPTPEATIDLNRPTATAIGHLSQVNSGDRLVIPKIGVDAQLVYYRVKRNPDGTGVMPDPQTPDEIAYYDFSEFPGMGGAPGLGGNAIFSGHVDSGRKACKNGTVPPPCTAVLWDMRDLRPGDIIEVHISGKVFKYAVTSNQPVPENSNFDPIFASTAKESLTLITCAGNFNRTTGRYTDRQVVTAEIIS